MTWDYGNRLPLSSLAALAGLPKLAWLHVSPNPVSDICPLADVMGLRRVWLGPEYLRGQGGKVIQALRARGVEVNI